MADVSKQRKAIGLWIFYILIAGFLLGALFKLINTTDKEAREKLVKLGLNTSLESNVEGGCEFSRIDFAKVRKSKNYCENNDSYRTGVIPKYLGPRCWKGEWDYTGGTFEGSEWENPVCRISVTSKSGSPF